MLPIILTILKIAGLLLLILVLLVVGLLLAVLFVPLRYRLRAVYTQEDTQGEVRITWLLHLISVRIRYQPSSRETFMSRESLQLKLRILGADPAAVSSFFKKKKKKKKQRNKNNGKEQAEEKTLSGTQTFKTINVQQTMPVDDSAPVDDDVPADETTPVDETIPVDVNDTGHNAGKHTGREYAAGEHTAESTARSTGEEYQDRTGPETSAGRDRHFAGHIRERIRSVLNRIGSFCKTLRRVPTRFRNAKKKIRRILKTPGELSRRVSKFRRNLEKCDADEVMKETFSRLKRMLRHFRIRKGKGFLRFGTGDPALTGELTGLLYLVLPVSCDGISLDPWFTETMLEMDLEVSGHIRLNHAVAAIWWAFRNQKLRRLIRMLRSLR